MMFRPCFHCYWFCALLILVLWRVIKGWAFRICFAFLYLFYQRSQWQTLNTATTTLVDGYSTGTETGMIMIYIMWPPIPCKYAYHHLHLLSRGWSNYNLYLAAVPASLPRDAATPPLRLLLTFTSSPARPWPAPTPSSLAPSSRGGGQCWRCSWLFSLEIQTTGKDDPLVGASSQIRESTSHFIFQNIA